MLTIQNSKNLLARSPAPPGEPVLPAPIPAEECARILMDTVPAVMRRIRQRMRRHGPPSLSIPQLRALGFLDRNPGACLSDLSDHLGVARPTASVIVNRLVQRQLVVRTDDPRERRRLVLRLTPDGMQLLRQARSATRAWIARLLTDLSEESLRQIAAGLALLGGAFKAGEAPEGYRPERPPGDDHGQ
jgi:DNA-binding MarR family transcriptional regulator